MYTYLPHQDHYDVPDAIIWLWSEKQGVLSHQTALALHGLSDVLPGKAHLALPSSWRKRRLRAPPNVFLHYGDVPKRERARGFAVDS